MIHYINFVYFEVQLRFPHLHGVIWWVGTCHHSLRKRHIYLLVTHVRGSKWMKMTVKFPG